MEETGSYRIPSVEHARAQRCDEQGDRDLLARLGTEGDGPPDGRPPHPQPRHLARRSGPMGTRHRRRHRASRDRPTRRNGERSCGPGDWHSGRDTLIRAIELMREQRTSHLIVTDTESGEPTRMISALDIAGVVGSGEG